MLGTKSNLKMTQVFIPGGFPTVTYIDRKEKQLEDRVSSAQDNLSKLVVVTGATKSGKTVLVDKVFPQGKAIWIDGGSISDESSFWELRNNIRDLLVDAPPQKNEISRVLDQIAKISYTDTSSTPVVDWQRSDDIITITDPFFAFFLKWART